MPRQIGGIFALMSSGPDPDSYKLATENFMKYTLKPIQQDIAKGYLTLDEIESHIGYLENPWQSALKMYKNIIPNEANQASKELEETLTLLKKAKQENITNKRLLKFHISLNHKDQIGNFAIIHNTVFFLSEYQPITKKEFEALKEYAARKTNIAFNFLFGKSFNDTLIDLLKKHKEIKQKESHLDKKHIQKQQSARVFVQGTKFSPQPPYAGKPVPPDLKVTGNMVTLK